MNLLDVVHRSREPAPWSEGDNIPWHDPDFSERMLEEHLSQEHDAASRRFEKIEQHVRWIHRELLLNRPARILDLGCGPGLYANQLARLGHACVGIDYSPASIAYAAAVAEEEDLRCRYVCEDIRTADYGSGYGLAMLIFGEFNVFRSEDIRGILRKAEGVLDDGGLILLEVHTFSAIQTMGEQGHGWYSAELGLFSAEPHLCLEESCWQPVSKTATFRYYVVTAATGNIIRFAQSMQAYSGAEYRSTLAECGFGDVRFIPSLVGNEAGVEEGLFVILGRKSGR
jgi:SAM-dependent methyltransferase